MYTPHVVTIYNVDRAILPNFEESESRNITILRGVFLNASKGVNVRETGLENADSVKLYIPFSIQAVDGITGAPKQYASPMEYYALSDKSGFWTLSFVGNGGETFFVKGEIVEDRPFDEISMRHDGVYTITKVDALDFGSPDMQHWEVGGA